MGMDEQDYIEYWRQMQDKIVKFKKLDDGKVIFGARTCQGHSYNVLLKVSDKEIMKFEKEHGLSLPLAYRTYLQIFAAGGAGPDNGIYDFRDSIMKGDYSEPFQYTQTIDRDDDNIDHDQLLKMPGTACISSCGNGAYCYLELNGPSPGQIWCSLEKEVTKDWYVDFYDFYDKWVRRTEVMQCDYVENPIGDEIWILFNQTPGKIILNKKRQVKCIDLK